MDLAKILASTFAAVISALLACQPGVADTKCVSLHDGVEYRAYLPDEQRFIYIAVKVLPGVYPSVFVIADKNYEVNGIRLAENDPLNAWWIDRSKIMTFSTDTVRVRWLESHTFDFVTDLFSKSDPSEIKQAFRGLAKSANGFSGSGANDTNTFAFQNRMELRGFSGDYFEVAVPAVTMDGTTATPPVVKFERQGDGFAAKC